MIPATGSITDVPGILVGHHSRLDDDATMGSGWATGTTVILTPPGTVGAVDARGGAPGTRETDLLDPANSVRHVDAVLLSGGSAYGLAAADGVMRYLEEQNRGVAMNGGVVPIVPGAVIFDLPVGGWQCRPDAGFGYAAARSARRDVTIGTVGAGVGARAGVLKGGIGTASTTVECSTDAGNTTVTVGALAVVNAAGNVVDPHTGLPWQADLIAEFGLHPPPADEIARFAAVDAEKRPLNTTLAAVATDARLGAGRAGPGDPAGPHPAGRGYGFRTGHRGGRGAAAARHPDRYVAGAGADHRGRGRRGGLSGPGRAGRGAGRRTGGRNTRVPGHVARSAGVTRSPTDDPGQADGAEERAQCW